jgi:hypothetical protein
VLFLFPGSVCLTFLIHRVPNRQKFTGRKFFSVVEPFALLPNLRFDCQRFFLRSGTGQIIPENLAIGCHFRLAEIQSLHHRWDCCLR